MIGANDSEREKIEIIISCRNLKNKDLFSKSDPFVKVYLAGENGILNYMN